MTGAVFIETLKRNWRQMFYWGIAMALFGFSTVVIIPNADSLNSYQQMIETMPPVLLQAFGAGDMQVMATPEGFIAFSFLTYVLLILLVYGVLAGLNITANEEDEGIMDFFMSLPVPRSRVIFEKFAVYALMVVGIVALSYVGMYAGAASGTLELDLGILTVGGLNIILGLLVVIALTAFVAAVVRRKSTATIIVASLLGVSYVVNVLGNVASDTAAAVLRDFSLFRYADAQYVVTSGFSAGSLFVLFAAGAIFLGGALWAWERRDIGI